MKSKKNPFAGTAKKFTPKVQLMLERSEAMEREAGLLRQLAYAEAQVAYFKGQKARRTRSNRAQSRALDA